MKLFCEGGQLARQVVDLLLHLADQVVLLPELLLIILDGSIFLLNLLFLLLNHILYGVSVEFQ